MNQDRSQNQYYQNPQQTGQPGYYPNNNAYSYTQPGMQPTGQQPGYGYPGYPEQQPAAGYTAPNAPMNGYQATNPYTAGAPLYQQQAPGTPGNGNMNYNGYNGQQPYAAPQGNSYIPQTPNYAQGYPNGFNNPYAGYQQGQQDPYAQMGRQPEKPPMQNGQVPLNGGGYVPTPVPLRKQPFALNDTNLIVISAVMLILFAVGMFVPALKVLKWVFLALAAAMIAMLWVKPVIAKNKRLCFTVVFGLLAAVSLASMFISGGTDGTGDPQNVTPGTIGSQANTSGQSGSQGGQVFSGVTEATAAPATPTPEQDNSNLVIERLYQFFQYWCANQTDEMLTLCSPSWQSSTDNPKAELFGLLANRTPKDYNFENISGTNDDKSRTVTLNSLMDRNNGKDPVRYRLNVIMIRDGDTWFVDPKSLQTYEAADTPDPNVTPTVAPTEEVHADANTVLYYNPDGGTKYHLDQNCKSTHKKYLPLKGHFKYSEINKDEYAKLSPCNVCGAPLR